MLTKEGVQQENGTAAGRGRRFRRRLQRQRAAQLSRPISEGALPAATSVREGLYRRVLAAADAIVAAIVVLWLLPSVAGPRPLLAAIAAIPLLILLVKAAGLYDRDELVLNKTTLDEVPALVQVAAVFTFLLWLFVVDGLSTTVQPADALVLWAGMTGLMLGGRTAARCVARMRTPAERCVVVGEDAAITTVWNKLASSHVNTEIVAILNLDGHVSASDDLAQAFRGLLRRNDVHRAIIAPAASDACDTLELIRIAKHAGLRVSVVPRVLEVVGSAVEFDHVAGLPMLAVRQFGLSRSSRVVKRGFDLLGASVLLAAVAPLLALIALAIRLDSRGPVFFRQTRVGKGGRRFEILKFRTMIAEADELKDALRHLNETSGLFKIADDPRITRVGRVLRRTSLDELPQLVNVWRGQMSLVGPRPLVVDEDAQVRGFDRHRLHLTPGMTGHWQILGSARIPMEEMVGIDYLYVANWSLWTDVKILLRTVPYVLASRGM